MTRSARRWLAAGLVALAVAFVYGPTLRGGWVWDDAAEVADNPALRGVRDLPGIWIAPKGVDYLPLKTTVQWVVWRIGGGRPVAFRVLNLGLHFGSACLLARLLLLLGAGDFAAWLAAGFFAVHPLGVESVAWISELKNTLSTVLVLASAVAFLRWQDGAPSSGGGTAREGAARNVSLPSPAGLHSENPAGLRPEKPAGRRPETPAGLRSDTPAALRPDTLAGLKPGNARSFYVLSLAFFLLALLAKASVVAFPCILLLFAWWRRGRVLRSDLLASVPFFALSAAGGAVAIAFQQTRAIAGFAVPGGGPAERIDAAGRAIAFYFAKAAWPSGLEPVYPKFHAEGGLIPGFLTWIALGAAGVALFGLRRKRVARTAALGLGSFALNLVPVLGFVPMAYLRIAPVADHFAYLSLLGAAGLAGAGFGWWLRRTTGRYRLAVLGLAGALGLAWAVAARHYAAVFVSDDRLWSYAVERNPSSPLICNNLGQAQFAEGRVAQARTLFERALALDPNDPEAHLNWGLVLDAAGRPDEACAEFRTALRLKPNLPQAHFALGNVYARTWRLRQAVDSYRAALALDPLYGAAWFNCGNAYLEAGNPLEAVVCFERTLVLDPSRADAQNNLGDALERLGRTPSARVHYEAALRIDSGFRPARENLDRLDRELRYGKRGDELPPGVFPEIR